MRGVSSLMSFMPTVSEITAEDAGRVPGLEGIVAYWTGGEYPAREWFEETGSVWGVTSLALRRDEEVLGYVLYAPAKYLSRSARYPLGPLHEDTVLLAYVSGDTRTRRHLLVRMLRDLRSRDLMEVQAIASDPGISRHPSTRFMLESGWQPVRRGYYRALPYTLVHRDLGSAIEVREVARGLMGRVRLPVLRKPVPAFSRSRRKTGQLSSGRTAVFTADRPPEAVARTSTIRCGY